MGDQANKGRILKQARESKRITLETVHLETKIPLDALKAIEEGYNVRILSPFYYRGFVKMYAQFLGLDLATVLDDQLPAKSGEKNILKKTGPVAEGEENSDNATENILDAVGSLFTVQTGRFLAKAVAVIVIGFLVVKFSGFLIQKISHRDSASISASSTKEKSKKAKSLISPVKSKNISEERISFKNSSAAQSSSHAASAVKAVSSSSKSAGVKKANLTVRAKKDSWLQVKVDGTVAFVSVLKKGANETWFGKETIELSGRNISELEFEINGKMIGLLGRQDRRAKKIVVTPEGFTIKE
ncbi:MAG: RodZ domain-containing protein [Candidatus Omnitrophota bacterium]